MIIHVRHRSRTSPWVPFSQCFTRQRCISPNHARPRTSTRRPHPYLGTSLPLAPSDEFRTETTSLLTTILCLIEDSTHSSATFDTTLNSSMMFSSLFAVVQSSEPHFPPCFAWETLTTSSSSASQPRFQFLSLTSCSSLSTSLRIVHLTHLLLLDMNSQRL